MNEQKILEVMEMAENRIKEAVKKQDLFIDDVSWGETCFKINIFKNAKDFEDFKKNGTPLVDEFFFSYNEDEEFYGNLHKQVETKLDEFLEKYEEVA